MCISVKKKNIFHFVCIFIFLFMVFILYTAIFLEYKNINMEKHKQWSRPMSEGVMWGNSCMLFGGLGLDPRKNFEFLKI